MLIRVKFRKLFIGDLLLMCFMYITVPFGRFKATSRLKFKSYMLFSFSVIRNEGFNGIYIFIMGRYRGIGIVWWKVQMGIYVWYLLQDPFVFYSNSLIPDCRWKPLLVKLILVVFMRIKKEFNRLRLSIFRKSLLRSIKPRFTRSP